MAGRLYGVGVGPGDPTDMTIKAVRTIEKCKYIAVPCSSGDKDMVAYNIARRMVDMEGLGKEMLYLEMPMIRDEDKLYEYHKKAADEISEVLDKGEDVAFLTLGDPTIYSTYIYVHKIVKEMGYDTEIISGITSFTASAAKLGVSLSERGDAVVIIPGSYKGLETALDVKGTKVLMKSGRKISEVKNILKNKGLYDGAMMVEKCSMEGEVLHRSLDTVGDDASYFSLIIVKEKNV